MLSAQFAFAMEGERTGRRGSVCLEFSASPGSLVARDVEKVLTAVAATNPALCYRPRFSRGEADQEWIPGWCDFAELGAESDGAADQEVVQLVAGFETDLRGAPLAAQLIRSTARDRLALVLDHALVDQQSLMLVMRQLAAPRDPDAYERKRFEAAVHDRFAFENAAAGGASVAFWVDRLASAGGTLPQVRQGTAVPAPTVALPRVAVSQGFRGSLFPYLLFSLHRAIRDVMPGSAASVVGYPWGGRDPGVADLVGCFMNTGVSLDSTDARTGPGAVATFRDAWFDELNHIDVPVTRLMSLDAGFTGAVSAYLSFSDGWLRTVNIAGTEAVQMLPAHAEIPVTSTFQAAASIRKGELQPWLIVDETVLGRSTDELGARWLHWLGEVLSR
ncbi:hypothetical protein [Nocardioides sp. InS609-2]|uniref:hypothetical protein n=1 Tax=Nocardioides sp. InS609-2 TaxID=2760705 RepID=UPI0020BE67C1|nr:hypothetical protein [Nocardioides sp. InS609-2]